MAESYADVRNGVVYNLALAEADYAALMGWIPAGNARIGDTWDGEKFSAPVIQPTVQEFHEALYQHFDKVAQADNWDNRSTLLARAGYEGHWQALALSFAEWMNRCELQALATLAEVQAGTATPPASIDAFLSALPAWERV